MSRNSRASVLLVTALAAAGLPLLVSGPAQAASVPLAYHCTTSPNVGKQDLTAVVDTDAPATLGSGLTTPISVTSDVTVPESLVTTLRGLGVATVEGTSATTGTVDGVARQANLSIPRTAVPASGAMHVVGTGAGGTITAGAVGSTILLGAGNFTATLTPRDSAGNVVAIPGTTTFTCALTPATGQNLLVDSVSVVPTPTTTTLTVTSPTEYGATVTVSAAVATAGTNTKPAGKVAFTYAGRTVTVDVKGGKAKADLGPAAAMGANAVTAVFTPADATKAASQASAAFTVARGSTTTTATAVYRAARDRIVGKALVEAVHGTEVAGKVRMKLKRNGTLIRTATVSLNAKDKAKKVFKNIRKPGTYVVVAKYLGSATLKRSKDTAKVVLP